MRQSNPFIIFSINFQSALSLCMDFIYVKGELNKNFKKKQFGFDFNKVMQD